MNDTQQSRVEELAVAYADKIHLCDIDWNSDSEKMDYLIKHPSQLNELYKMTIEAFKAGYSTSQSGLQWVKFSDRLPKMSKWYHVKWGIRPEEQTFCFIHEGGQWQHYTEWLDESSISTRGEDAGGLKKQEDYWYKIKEEMMEAMDKCATPEQWVECMKMQYFISPSSSPSK